jgi:hypothetical protein
LAIADGGTGQSTAAAAITALTGTQTSGRYLRSDGTNAALAAIVAADVPTLNQNTTGTAANVTGIVAISNGGTGQTTANAAFNALAPSQTSNSGKYLTTDGTNTSWATNASGTVTSVAASVPTFLSVSGSPITTSGTLAITLSGTALPTANGGTGLTSFTTNGVAYATSTSALTTSSALTFDGANIGLGVTLSSWSSNYRAIQLGDSTSSGAIYQSISGGTLSIASNEYISATGPRYINTAPANRFLVGNGIHSWYTAASGTAGTAISYTQAMTLDASGNLFINNLTASKVVFTDASKNLTSTGTVAIAQGGTGTATPALVAGTNVTITGTWPNQTINSSNTGGTVTSVAATVPSFLSITGSPITTSGTLAITLSGTALPTTSGGTGLTSFTANGVVYASSTSALATGSGLTFDGTSFSVGETSAGKNIKLYSSSAGSNGLLRLYDTGNTERYQLAVTTSLVSNYAPASTAYVWYVDSEQMRLTSTGLGIGTSSPAYKLQVIGASNFQVNAAGTQQVLQLNNSDTTAGTQAVKLGFSSSGVTKASINAAVYGNDYMTFNVGSDTERMRIDASGNLGLGVTPSASNLATIQSSYGILSGNNQINIAANAYYNNQWNYTSTAVASLYTQTAGQHRWFNAPSGTAGNAITFTQAMTLDASGNLGIGTTSPIGRFNASSTSGNVIVLDSLKTTSGAADTGAGIEFVGSDGSAPRTFGVIGSYKENGTSGNYASYMAFSTRTNGSAVAERARIDSSGNLLVGHTSNLSSGAKILVKGSVLSTSSTFDNSSTGGAIAMFCDNANYGTIWALKNGNTAWGDVAIVPSGGNLLVGTTTAAGKLTVNGSNSSGSGSIQGANASNLNMLYVDAPNFPLGVNASNGGSVELVRFYSGGTTVGTISYNGTATLYNATSDQRLKENIVDAQEFGSVIDSIQVRSYDWKSNGSHQRAGFIAQELVSVAPEAVYQPEDPEEMMAVDYSKLVPMLVKEIQSLRKRLADAGL